MCNTNIAVIELSFQENYRLIEEKQVMLLDLVKKLVKESKNTEFLISLRCTEVTDKDTIKKLLLILLENVDFKVRVKKMHFAFRQCFCENKFTFLSFQNNEAEFGDIKEQLLRLDTLELIDPLGIEFNWQFFVHHPNMFKLITKLMNKVRG